MWKTIPSCGKLLCYNIFMELPLLQTKKWQKLQQDLKKTTFFEQNSNFSYLAILENTPMGNYLYIPYGPIADTLPNFKNAIKELKKNATENSAFFIRIEPQNTSFLPFLNKNAKKTTDLNPKETWILDLPTDETELKNKLPSRLLRYYKNREKSGLSIETSKNPADIKYLVDLQQKLAKTKKINIFSENYLKTELMQDFSTLYLVKFEQKVVAAGLVFDDDNTRYNLQGAQDENFRKLHATGILTIQLILDAAAKKLKKFDFWGIAPENSPKNHPWAGFTAFKKTFNGREVAYCGTFDLILHRQKYTIYSLLRKINRLFRKFI